MKTKLFKHLEKMKIEINAFEDKTKTSAAEEDKLEDKMHWAAKRLKTAQIDGFISLSLPAKSPNAIQNVNNRKSTRSQMDVAP